MEYLSPSDYKRAEMEYGISNKLLSQRFYDKGWPKERAITEPVHFNLWNNFKEIAEAHGVGQWTFYTRVKKLNYCPGKAATQPVLGKGAKAHAKAKTAK